MAFLLSSEPVVQEWIVCISYEHDRGKGEYCQQCDDAHGPGQYKARTVFLFKLCQLVADKAVQGSGQEDGSRQDEHISFQRGYGIYIGSGKIRISEHNGETVQKR